MKNTLGLLVVITVFGTSAWAGGVATPGLVCGKRAEEASLEKAKKKKYKGCKLTGPAYNTTGPAVPKGHFNFTVQLRCEEGLKSYYVQALYTIGEVIHHIPAATCIAKQTDEVIKVPKGGRASGSGGIGPR